MATVVTGSKNTAASLTAAAGARLNPYRDPRPWSTVTLVGTKSIVVPGIIVSIDGADKIEEWAVQKGIEVSHAVTVWRGTKLAEGIRILTNLYDEASFDSYYDLRDALSPKSGAFPPTHQVLNGAINFSGITRVNRVNCGPPKPAAGLSWTGEITLIEFNPPKKVPVGPAPPPKNKTPTEQDKVAAEIAAASIIVRNNPPF